MTFIMTNGKSQEDTAPTDLTGDTYLKLHD